MKTLVNDKVWVIDNFLSEDDYSTLIRKWVDNEMQMFHVNNLNTKPTMADTNMSYRVKTIPQFQPIYDSLEKNLNIKIPKRRSTLAMQYKQFMPGDGYDLHAEDSRIYGDYVYVMYLTDEDDGAIVLPSYEDHVTSKGFDEMQEIFNITFAPKTISYLPKANTCLVMKTGIAHLVEPCTGRRDTIAGWPFSSFEKK